MLRWKKSHWECIFAIVLLVCFYCLSWEVAKAEPMKRKGVIVLDAGHGGIDPGVIGLESVEEKKINLEIAQKLKKTLEEKGFSVKMTREVDEGLYQEETQNKKAEDLQRRIQIFSETEALLAISIHQNSYPDASVKGPQVFYYQDSEEGRRLAQSIQGALNALPEVEKPRIEKGNTSYYLLKRSSCVTNIVECGFLTNPEEVELLQSERYQEKIVEAIADGMIQFLEGK